MTEELKSCPFCGFVGLDFVDGGSHRWGLALCSGCGATQGEVRREYPDTGAWHASAIAEWNTRALLAELNARPGIPPAEA